MKSYFEAFFVQLSSPIDKPIGEIYILEDECEIMGLFVQNSSREELFASKERVRTQGRFVTSKDAKVDNRTVLRRARDGTLVELIGEPIPMPKRAKSGLKVYDAQIIEN